MEFIYSINHERSVIKHNNEFWTMDGELLKGKLEEVKYFDYDEECYKTKMMWNLDSKNTKHRMKWTGGFFPKDEDILNRKNWKRV